MSVITLSLILAPLLRVTPNNNNNYYYFRYHNNYARPTEVFEGREEQRGADLGRQTEFSPTTTRREKKCWTPSCFGRFRRSDAS